MPHTNIYIYNHEEIKKKERERERESKKKMRMMRPGNARIELIHSRGLSTTAIAFQRSRTTSPNNPSLLRILSTQRILTVAWNHRRNKREGKKKTTEIAISIMKVLPKSRWIYYDTLSTFGLLKIVDKTNWIANKSIKKSMGLLK